MVACSVELPELLIQLTVNLIKLVIIRKHRNLSVSRHTIKVLNDKNVFGVSRKLFFALSV